jgi:hypothetical protein
MQRLVFLLILGVLSLSVVFSSDVNLVSYYDSTVNSHACKSGDPSCAYSSTIYIDSTYSASCASGVRVLGLSGLTNAHAETNAFSFYDTNICMKSDTFSASTCYYSAAGVGCNTGYNCLFGLSGTNNAHLSSCGIFGNDEISFCCKPGVLIEHPDHNIIIPPGGCNLFLAQMKNAIYNKPVDLTVACKISEDVNIYFFTKQGDLISGPLTDTNLRNVTCTSMGNVFNKFSLPQNDKLGTYMVRVVGKECSIDTFFTATPEPGQVIPDSNPIIAVIVCIIVISIIIGRKKD